jgi:hypothetical protein
MAAVTAAMVASVKTGGGQVEAVPDRGVGVDILVTRLNCCLAAFCVLMVSLSPLGAVAQITEPLLPLLPSPAPPTAPQAPASAPGDQPTYAGQTVTSRVRPEFDPIGLRLGNFFWFPRAELDEAYNSNIFATTTRPTYDLLTTLTPSFDLLSIFPRSTLNLHASAVQQVYADHPAQNTQDGTISVDGGLPVTAGSSFYGAAQVSHQHISYGSPNSPGNIAQPVTYWDYIARAGYVEGGRRFSYGVDVGVVAAQYNAAPLVGGGVSPQSSQDATLSSATVRANYEIAPDYLGYVRVAGSLYDYWHTVPGATRPNSTTYRIDLGLLILPKHIIYGQVYAGYLIQNFAQSSLGSTPTVDYGGQLVWNVTPLTTLTFTGVRTFITGSFSNPTLGISGPAGNGYLATVITANADHELLRNLVLNVKTSYETDDFQGITRTDTVFTGGAGLRYLVNRNLFLGGLVSYQQRSSTVAGSSYGQTVLTLRVGTQF